MNDSVNRAEGMLLIPSMQSFLPVVNVAVLIALLGVYGTERKKKKENVDGM